MSPKGQGLNIQIQRKQKEDKLLVVSHCGGFKSPLIQTGLKFEIYNQMTCIITINSFIIQTKKGGPPV